MVNYLKIIGIILAFLLLIGNQKKDLPETTIISREFNDSIPDGKACIRGSYIDNCSSMDDQTSYLCLKMEYNKYSKGKFIKASKLYFSELIDTGLMKITFDCRKSNVINNFQIKSKEIVYFKIVSPCNPLN